MRWYLIDADGYLVNVIVWDGEAEVDFGDGIKAVRADSVKSPPKRRPQESDA